MSSRRADASGGGAGGRASHLCERLRLIVITDTAQAEKAGHASVLDVVRAAVHAGAPAIQLRDKAASARELAQTGRALLAITRPAGALLFVNDRLDVALAIGADGVHVGPDDLPVAAVRDAVRQARAAGVDAAGHTASDADRRPDAALPFLVGTSTDDPDEARRLVAEGADYIGCGTVYPTSSKPNAGEVIGLDGLQRVVDAIDTPVVAIGGVTAERAEEIGSGTGAAGVAVIGAVMGAEDAGDAVRALLGCWSSARPAG